MNILVIEDDEDQAIDLEAALRIEFRDAVFTRIELEHEFVGRFEELASKHFDLAVIDVMLEWIDPIPDAPARPGPFEDAGFRCRNKLKSDPRTAGIPIIMFSVLGRQVAPDINYVVKTDSFTGLIEKARSLLRPQH
jgi:CheY-like chemotaxis protein